MELNEEVEKVRFIKSKLLIIYMRIVSNETLDVSVLRVKFSELKTCVQDNNYLNAIYKCDELLEIIDSTNFKKEYDQTKKNLKKSIKDLRLDLNVIHKNPFVQNVHNRIIANLSKIESIINKNESRTKVSLWSRIFG